MLLEHKGMVVLVLLTLHVLETLTGGGTTTTTASTSNTTTASNNVATTSTDSSSAGMATTISYNFLNDSY